MKISFFSFFGLGCVCFGWKLLPEMLFRKWGCLVGPENSIFRKLKSVDWKKKPLTTEIVLHFYFPFKVFPENERERERKRARALDRDLQAAISSSLIAISSPRSPVRVRDLQSVDPAPSLIAISSPRPRDAVDRDLAKRIEIAIDGAISRRSRSRRRSRSCLREIAPDRDRDRRRELAKIAITISPLIGRRMVFSVVVEDFFLGYGLCFSGFVFSFFFSKHQKIFFGKFFEMQPNTMETFSFSGKYVFSRKRFPTTKRSLSIEGRLVVDLNVVGAHWANCL